MGGVLPVSDDLPGARATLFLHPVSQDFPEPIRISRHEAQFNPVQTADSGSG